MAGPYLFSPQWLQRHYIDFKLTLLLGAIENVRLRSEGCHSTTLAVLGAIPTAL